MDQVRVCRVCGHPISAETSTRCRGCWTFLAGNNVILRPGARRGIGWPRLGWWRRRHLYLGLGLLLALTVWKAVTLFDLVPLVYPPPAAAIATEAAGGPHIWSQARGSAQSTGFTTDPAPYPARVKWTFSSSDALVSSPAVVGDRVFLTTEDGRTLSLDRHTGRVVWERRNGYPSSSTPAVTDDLVIFAVRPGLVVALERATGRVRWERDLGNPVLASPVVAGGSVYIGSGDSNLYALDVATGQRRWAYPTKAWITEPVAYAGGTVAVASQDSRLNIVGDRTARRRLLYDTGRGRGIVGGPAIQGDRVYVGSRDGRVWAIDRRARTYPFGRTVLLWQLNLYLWGMFPEPVQKGSIWSTSVGGKISVGPAVTPTTVYAANRKGRVTALNAVTGEKRWAADVGAEVTAAPAAAGGAVLLGTKDGRVVALDEDQGKLLWQFETKGPITASPVVVGDTMYVASHDGNLYAVTGP